MCYIQKKNFKQNFKTFKGEIYPPEKGENIKKMIKKIEELNIKNDQFKNIYVY